MKFSLRKLDDMMETILEHKKEGMISILLSVLFFSAPLILSINLVIVFGFYKGLYLYLSIYLLSIILWAMFFVMFKLYTKQINYPESLKGEYGTLLVYFIGFATIANLTIVFMEAFL